MADDLKALGQRTVVLTVDPFMITIRYVQDLLGVFLVLPTTVNFQLHAQVEIAVRAVEDGFGLVVVVLDGSVAFAVEALVAIREVAAVLIPGLIVGDQRPTFLAGGITVIPASLAKHNALISLAVLTPDSGAATITLGRQRAVTVVAQECPVKHVAIRGTDRPLTLTAKILFVHFHYLR
jgi:hypothetical protein